MTQNKYLDPTNDVAFKKVFTDPAELISLLNATLRLSDDKKIQEIEFMVQEEIPDVGEGKRSMFDIKCRDKVGNQFIIEMQNRKKPSLLKRVQYYGSHAYVAQLKVGITHEKLMPVIVIVIIKEDLFPSDVDCINFHRNIETKTNKQLLPDLSYMFIELSKFKKTGEELNSIEDYWLYFLKNSEVIKEPPKTIKDAAVLKAYDMITQFNWTDVEYDAYIRARLFAEAEELDAEESYSSGKAEGKAEGEAIGLAKGEEIGVIKGKAEGAAAEREKSLQRLKQAAINLSKQGKLNDVEICEAIGLSEAELAEFKRQDKL